MNARYTPRGSMRLFQQPRFRQVRHDVADAGRTQPFEVRRAMVREPTGSPVEM